MVRLFFSWYHLIKFNHKVYIDLLIPFRLRALSHPNPGTNNQNNQPLANFVGNPPKYKLADYRYGREEMLALFDKNSRMPDSIKDLTMIASEKCQLPLAFVTMSDDEQVWKINQILLPRRNYLSCLIICSVCGQGQSIAMV